MCIGVGVVTLTRVQTIHLVDGRELVLLLTKRTTLEQDVVWLRFQFVAWVACSTTAATNRSTPYRLLLLHVFMANGLSFFAFANTFYTATLHLIHFILILLILIQ